MAEAYPGPPAATPRREALGQPQRAPRPGGGDGRQAFREDAAAAATIAAKPFADAQLERTRYCAQGRSARVRP